MLVDDILKDLENQSLKLVYEKKEELNIVALELLTREDLYEEQVETLRKILNICNITYNNTDKDILPIEDGIYDLLIEKYRKFTKEDIYPVGANPIKFESKNEKLVEDNGLKSAFGYLPEKKDDELFNIVDNKQAAFSMPCDYISSAFLWGNYITKRKHDISHEHPELVGTFDKCKYVLNSQAEEKGVYNDSNVRIVERDFIKPLIEKGIMDPNAHYTMIAQLKYDGVSVEADVTDMVISARSRGDTENSKAIDMTPILYGYKFPRMRARNEQNITPVGMKFEAIVNKFNMAKLNEMKGYNYANCRTAIIGLTGSSDAYRYRDLITLVPISSTIKVDGCIMLDRLDELDLLNYYYNSGEPLRYEILEGNYISLLYQMKKYVEEAEAARAYLPFMYDGVVFEFYGSLREVLGRDHSIDRYKVAVKFNPDKKQTIFRGYKYTIGQDGRITPMIYYDPVEFFGTIHPKSSGHSYKRFKELDLHVGDIIDVEYVNDVMPYVTKPHNEHNVKNSQNPYNEKDTFPTHCPCCGAEIVISPTGKTAYCPNNDCGNRTVMRLTSTFNKLGIKDFKEERIKAVGLSFLWEYIEADPGFWNYINIGSVILDNLLNQIQLLQQTPIYDYNFIGSLGFTGVAKRTWKLIFSKITLRDLYNAYTSNIIVLHQLLVDLNIKGIGPSTIDTICEEFGFFLKDIKVALNRIPIIDSKGQSQNKQIRFTGIRDVELCKQLISMGHDADGDLGITKQTDILLVPNESYDSGSKIQKAKRYGIQIIPIQTFKDNMGDYL